MIPAEVFKRSSKTKSSKSKFESKEYAVLMIFGFVVGKLNEAESVTSLENVGRDDCISTAEILFSESFS